MIPCPGPTDSKIRPRRPKRSRTHRRRYPVAESGVQPGEGAATPRAVVIALQADMWDPAAAAPGGDGLNRYTPFVQQVGESQPVVRPARAAPQRRLASLRIGSSARGSEQHHGPDPQYPARAELDAHHGARLDEQARRVAAPDDRHPHARVFSAGRTFPTARTPQAAASKRRARRIRPRDPSRSCRQRGRAATVAGSHRSNAGKHGKNGPDRNSRAREPRPSRRRLTAACRRHARRTRGRGGFRSSCRGTRADAEACDETLSGAGRANRHRDGDREARDRSAASATGDEVRRIGKLGVIEREALRRAGIGRLEKIGRKHDCRRLRAEKIASVDALDRRLRGDAGPPSSRPMGVNRSPAKHRTRSSI